MGGTATKGKCCGLQSGAPGCILRSAQIPRRTGVFQGEFHMFRTILTPLMGLLGLAVLTSGALASDPYGSNDDGYVKVWKPYVVEKNCTDGIYECRARMDYAPFQRSMVARYGSYWYQKPFMVYRYGDFRPQRASWGHHSADHVAWCSAHYRTYDPATNLYKGRGYQLYKCNGPYAGR